MLPTLHTLFEIGCKVRRIYKEVEACQSLAFQIRECLKSLWYKAGTRWGLYLFLYRTRSQYFESLRRAHYMLDPCAAYRNHRVVYLPAGHAFLSRYERGLQIRHDVCLVRSRRAYLRATYSTVYCLVGAESGRYDWRLQSMSSAGSAVNEDAQARTKEEVNVIAREDEYPRVVDIG